MAKGYETRTSNSSSQFALLTVAYGVRRLHIPRQACAESLYHVYCTRMYLWRAGRLHGVLVGAFVAIRFRRAIPLRTFLDVSRPDRRISVLLPYFRAEYTC